MINLPVEPIILERHDLPQLFSSERAADRFAREIPRGRGLSVDKLDGRRIGFNEKFQRTPAKLNLRVASISS
jgi:hypothetical protein